MRENHEGFKNLTSGIRNIVIIVAVILGGAWTAYTFRALGARERARFERDKAEFDLEVEKAMQARQANFGLDVSVEAKQEQSPDNIGYYIAALVKITNKGSRNKVIDFKNSPLRVLQAGFDEKGNSHIYDLIQQENFTPGTVLRAGATETYPYLVRVPRPGFYFINIEIELNEDELKVFKESRGPAEKGVWGGSTYVFVK